jgi:DNA polymerase III subunit beta
MRLGIERDALADAVAWVARALPSRPVVPILAGLFLDASATGVLTLSCFDYEVSARAGTGADVTTPGKVLVSGRLLAEIARSLPRQRVDMSSEGDSVILSCGNARFTLLSLPVDDYPALPELPPRAGTVDGGELAVAVAQVAVAAGRDETLPMLTGILAEMDGPQLTLVATDRYRMAMRKLGWEPQQPDASGSALVPARTFADLARTMTAGAGVAISLAAKEAADLIGFESGGRRLTTRLLGTEFITYKSRFPSDPASRARVRARPFAEAIRRVALVADRESRLLLTFGRDEVVLETGSGEGSRAVETMEAGYDGDEGFTIAFKPQFLLDGVVAAEAGSTEKDEEDHYVDLEFGGADKPAVITGSPDFRYLLAPMRT